MIAKNPERQQMLDIAGDGLSLFCDMNVASFSVKAGNSQ